MTRAPVDLAAATTQDRLAALADTARVLAEGSVVVAPAETGALVIGSIAQAGPGLARAAGHADPLAGPAWLCPGVEGVLELTPRAARRVVRTLSPGPAVYHLVLEESALAEARRLLGAAPGVADDGSRLRVRVADWATPAGTLAQRVGAALAAWEAGEDGAAVIAQRGLAPGLVLTGGGGRAGPGGGATHVEIGRTGGVKVLREGAYEARYVMKHAGLSVLFVCTGNTCRSPMAEAIARGLAEAGARERPGPPVRFSSAGVGAGGGAPPAPEGVAAVRSLGFDGPRCASRPLTRELVREADAVYAMTRSHLAAVLSLDPSAAGKAELLDPDGGDVPDPIGMGRAEYDRTAGRLRELIARRLAGLTSRD